MSTKTDGKSSEETGASGPANVTGENNPSQTQDVAAGGGGMGDSGAGDKDGDAQKKEEGDPVSVATGAVVEKTLDVALAGLIPFRFVRRYSSADCFDTTPLGRGGWTHDYHQWVEPHGEGFQLRNFDGVDLLFGPIADGSSALHRGRRLLLNRRGERFVLLDLASRATRIYKPLRPNEKAWLSSISDGYGNKLVFEYDGVSLHSVTDTCGRQIFFRRDDEQRIVAIDVGIPNESRPNSFSDVRRLASFGYTPVGELALAADSAGHATRYAYDGKHRVVRKQHRNGFAVHYEYHPDHGRVTRTWGDNGYHQVEFTYDFDKRTTTTSSGPEPRIYHWDARGNILKEETFDGRYAVEQTWDDDHLLLSEKNAAGEENTYEYNARGFLVKHTDPAGNSTIYEYVDDLLRRVVDPSGNAVTYEYDGYGGVCGITVESGARYSVDRDGRGRIVATYGPAGLLQRTEYDSRNGVARIVDPLGRSTTYEQDALGRPIQRTDAANRVTRIVYDASGRIARLSLPDGSSQSYEYDPSGNLTRVSKPGGDVLMEYVATGSLARAIFEDGSEWHVRYDREEKPVRITNPKREQYELVYDRAGRVVEERTFDGRTLRYGYDLAGRLRRVDQPDGTYRAFEYNSGGHLVEETSTHGLIFYKRDPLGRLLEARLEEGPVVSTVAFTRDAFGRVVSESQDGQNVSYQYDAENRVVSRTLHSGEVTGYTYDPAGRLIQVAHGGQAVVLARDDLGREISRHFRGCPLKIASTYDLMGRLAEQCATALQPEAAGLLGTLLERRYHYDETSRPTRIEDARWGATAYFYDQAHNLVRAQQGSFDEAFEYDPAGALIGAFSGLHRKGDQWGVGQGGLLARTENAIYEVDACHRRTRKHEYSNGKLTGRSTHYVWDCRDRLREARLPSGETVRYFYDALGRRTRKIVFPASQAGSVVTQTPSRITRFLWDGDVLAKEVDSVSGDRVFVHEPGTFRPILQTQQKETFLYVLDHLGTPRELIDAAGRVAWAASFATWGRLNQIQRDTSQNRERPVESPFRLLGHYADDETGLHFTRFRYWDPDTARWLSADPLGLWGSRRQFSFDAAPTVFRDPLGLTGETPNVLNIGAGPNPMPGATNIDINPGHASVQKMDANAMTFPSNHFDKVHAINPYGYNPVSDEVARVMKPGGELVISVNTEKNPFTPGKKKAPISSDLELVSGPSPLADEHKFAKMKRADGGDVNEDAVKTFVFRKKKPGEAKSAEKKGTT
ncbi:MAG: RHS domain-containing protein [Polyangiaceae bacterium]|nr:RHS domain-containing protein [Polyangiaceae bacterium]